MWGVGILFLFLLLFPSGLRAGIFLDVNRAYFHAGDELKLYAGNNQTYNETVDVYIAFEIPGYDGLFYWPSFSQEPTPCVSKWDPYVVPEVEFFSYKFKGSEPEGEYKVYAAFLRHGSMAAEDLIGDIAMVSFYFGVERSNSTQEEPQEEQEEENPPEEVGGGGSSGGYGGGGAPAPSHGGETGPVIVSVVPKNGEVFHTLEPEFYITFRSPVDLDSIINHVRIQVKSLVSGKVATLFPDEGDIWVELYIPGDEEMWVYHRVSESDLELIDLETRDGGKTVYLHFHPVTIEGETFSFHYGGRYRLEVEFLEGAKLTDGTGLSGLTVGPLDFSIEP